MKILKILKIIPSCKQIYGPWIVSSGKKSNTTTIVSDRWRFWSDHIFLFQIFVTLLSNRLGWFSILLENECFENPENQPKWLASLLILNKLFVKNGCNQNLRLIKLMVMVYFIFAGNFVWGDCKWSQDIIGDRKKSIFKEKNTNTTTIG